MKRFTNDIIDIKRGETDINKVYRGENLVWERSSGDISALNFIYYSNLSGNWGIRDFETGAIVQQITRSGSLRRINVNSQKTEIAVTSNNAGLFVYNFSDRTLLKNITGTGDIEGVSFDTNGNYVVARNTSLTVGFLSVYDKDTDVQLLNIAQSTRAIAACSDDNNNYYSFNWASILRKYDNSGNLIWERNNGKGDTRSAKIKGNFLLIGGANGSTIYNLDGDLLYNFGSALGDAWGFEFDGDFVYTAGQSTTQTVKKFDLNGDLIWTVGLNTRAYTIDLDQNFLYVSGTVAKIDKITGSVIYNQNLNNTVNGLVVRSVPNDII